MPGYDRTGPIGAGPRTGGGFGYCGAGAQDGRPRTMTGGFGFGRGWGARGHCGQRGRQFRRFRNLTPPGFGPWEATVEAVDEARLLKEQAHRIREELASIEARLTQLQNRPDDYPAE